MTTFHTAHAPRRSDIQDGMRIDWDVPIEMDDGIVLRADVFRPARDGRFPPILSCGPYGKELGWKPTYSTYRGGIMATLSSVRVGTLSERLAPPAFAKDNRA